MPKFRKRPVVIEADQWFPYANIEGVCTELDTGIPDYPGGPDCPHIHTLEGVHRVSFGDWIITGVSGERYPCKPAIFAATYERVEDE